MRIGICALLLGVPSFLFSQTFDPPRPMVVQIDVADVRSVPSSRKLVVAYDELQETQLERGEPVLVFERQGAWARIEATDQPEYTHNDRWQGYPGWVEWKSLSLNLKKVVSLETGRKTEEDLRAEILRFASVHIGEAYLWGGRSLFDPKSKSVLTGVDCSGLVNRSFRRAGLRVPRDAHEQFMRARPVAPAALKPGDLIFLAKAEKPDKMVHVALYAGGDDLIEAPQTGEKVRRISFRDRFGKPLSDIKPGDRVGDRVIRFGTLFVEGLWPN